MNPSEQYDIFVSYSSHDRNEVLRYVKPLQDQGYHLWFDRHKILGGDYYATEIEYGIQRSRSFMIFCSPKSLESGNVLDEVASAKENRVPLMLPIWLCPPFPYPTPFALHLRRPQYIETHQSSAQETQAKIFGILQKNSLGPSDPNVEWKDFALAFNAKRWEEAIRLGERLQNKNHDHPDLLRGLERARRKLEEEEESIIAPLKSGKASVDGWQKYLDAYPNGCSADQARFYLSNCLPLGQLAGFLQKCESSKSTVAGGSLGWQIAEAICRIRLRQREHALELLEAIHRKHPTNPAVLHYLALAKIAHWGVGGLMSERVQEIEEVLTLSTRLSPNSGRPLLLAAFLDLSYYQPRKRPGPFGNSSDLLNRAAKLGMTQDDFNELYQLLS